MKGHFLILVLSLFLMSSCETIEPTKTTTYDFDFTPTANIDGHDYVDLGLSVMWATCNVGATSAEKAGEYYAWQETVPYSSLTEINYMMKFNPCNPDNILSSKYDAARINWGKNWRMPTYDDIDELCRNCIWQWTDDFNNTKVCGCIIKSKKSDKAIFIPCCGYKSDNSLHDSSKAYYWTSYAGPGNLWNGLISAICMKFSFGMNFSLGGTWDTQKRGNGLPIRAVVGHAEEYIPEGPYALDDALTSQQGYSVSGKKGTHTYVDLGLPSRTLWATYNVGATSPHEYGDYFAWGETTPKSYYWDDTYKFYAGSYGTWIKYSKYTWFTAHHGSVDGKTILEPEDDAATQNMGAAWCMPTKDQLQELCRYVQWRLRTTSDKDGWIGTSKINGHTIFLPSAGWEYRDVPNNHMMPWYWSSELNPPTADGSDYYAYMLINSPNGGLEVKDAMRIQGLSVRGVTK